MYQSSYAEVLADSAEDARGEERRALDHAVALLEHAMREPPRSDAEREATRYVTLLWGAFVKSLAGPDNDLPKPLRASLMSIGLGVMAEAGRIDAGLSRDLAGLASICGIIRDGLA